MTRLTWLRAASAMVFAAAFASAAPAFATEGASTVSASAVRDAVIAMTVADAALPVAIAVRADASAPVETMAAPEATGAMAAMRPVPMRRARVAAYDRRVRVARNDFGCSGPWCGRHVVLMLGVGF